MHSFGTDNQSHDSDLQRYTYRNVLIVICVSYNINKRQTIYMDGLMALMLEVVKTADIA